MNFFILNSQLSILNSKKSSPKGERIFLFFFLPLDDALFHVAVSFFRREPLVALLNQHFVEVQTSVRMIEHFVRFILFVVHLVSIFFLTVQSYGVFQSACVGKVSDRLVGNVSDKKML
jgi:hypothetical protein